MDDLISRQNALTEIRKDGKWLEEQGVTSMTTNEREMRDTFILREMPSAQPKTPLYVAEIEAEYRKWVNVPHIRKPLAKALYEVWKKHDREDMSRNG